jgi:hypothetical protein
MCLLSSIVVGSSLQSWQHDVKRDDDQDQDRAQIAEWNVDPGDQLAPSG